MPAQIFASGTTQRIEAVIAWPVAATERDAHGRATVTIATDQPWGSESVDGKHTLEVTADQLVRKA